MDMEKTVSNIQQILSNRHIRYIIWVLLCLMPILGMAVDLVAPSLPLIAYDLYVSSGIAKNVITLYLLGYALGNFFSGFLTDAIGRRKILWFGLFSFVIVSLLPVVLPDISVVLVARFLQGLTIGGVAVVARAIFSDILTSEQLIKIGVLSGSMFGLGPVIGPFIGGYLAYYIGWQACFIFFAIVAFVFLITVHFVVPETHYYKRRLEFGTIKSNLVELFIHKKFMALVIIMGSVYSLIITFSTTGPFLIQSKLHYSAVFFGNVALYMGLCFLLATFVCRFLLRRRSVDQLFFIFINLFFSLTILLLIISFFCANSISILSIASAIAFFAAGFLFPMSMGKGLSLFRHIAGTATATMFLINVLMTSLASFLINFINVQSVSLLIFIYLLLLGICTLVYWKLIHDSSNTLIFL